MIPKNSSVIARKKLGVLRTPASGLRKEKLRLIDFLKIDNPYSNPSVLNIEFILSPKVVVYRILFFYRIPYI
ncbi:MAG: hypothetical protein COB67_02860 [SAR324 cluster bacterium]|uniref:Uncharacterized protein n=1 Tax=SAR324 cluster bacterium TaxID=2024889 RepID=A0A2A4T9N8_9DELT|nr:MAG: hypothetical protein COB67_02860 [SAR324 cluster bacterium]